MNAFLDITLGNVITWAGLLVGIGAAWQHSVARFEKNAAKIEVLKDRITANEIKLTKVEEERSQLSTIKNDVKWLKKSLAKRFHIEIPDDDDNE